MRTKAKAMSDDVKYWGSEQQEKIGLLRLNLERKLKLREVLVLKTDLIIGWTKGDGSGVKQQI